MKTINRYLLTLIGIMFILSCNRKAIGQKSNANNYNLDSFYQQVWIPSTLDEVYDQKIKDTLRKSLEIVFEQNFDDSIYIKVNDQVVYETRIKTHPKFSVVKSDFEIDYSNYQYLPTISIILVEKKKGIEFKLLPGYRVVYINRILNIWELNFSNYPRNYY